MAISARDLMRLGEPVGPWEKPAVPKAFNLTGATPARTSIAGLPSTGATPSNLAALTPAQTKTLLGITPPRVTGLNPTGPLTPFSGPNLTARTPAQTEAALGGTHEAPPIIVNKQATGTPLKGSAAEKTGWLAPQDSLYGAALGRERNRIDNEQRAWREKKAKEKAELGQKAKAGTQAYYAALEAANAQYVKDMAAWEDWSKMNKKEQDTLVARGLRTRLTGPPVLPLNDPKFKEMYNGVLAMEQAVTDFDKSLESDFQTYFAPMEKTFNDAVGIASQLTTNSKKQKELDAAYAKASEDYKNAVTQYDKDRAARKMWEAKNDMYANDAAAREADINAGKYAVNPYQFLAQGASLPEIADLRNQVNTGNLRPNMRVPAEFVAPTEVADPGEFKTAKPVHERLKDPDVSDDIANILGYQGPAPVVGDPTAPAVSTEDVDTSGVKTQYAPPKPEDKLKSADELANPTEAPTGTKTAPVAAPAPTSGTTGADTLQQTSTTVQASKQPPVPQDQPAPALAPQPTGSVAGQTGVTGQAPAQEKPPEEKQKPKPFAEDNAEEDEENVFQPK